MSTLSLAFNRFGLGARNDDNAPEDPRRWLAQQLDRYDARPEPIAAAPQRGQVASQLAAYFEEVRSENQARRRAGQAPLGPPATPARRMTPAPAPNLRTAPPRRRPEEGAPTIDANRTHSQAGTRAGALI